MEKLRLLDVSSKPMFGAYGLYHKGKDVAAVCDDTLYLKVTDPGSRVAGGIATDSPYPRGEASVSDLDGEIGRSEVSASTHRGDERRAGDTEIGPRE